MALTKTDRSTIEKARAGGAAELAVTLDDEVCVGLLAIICHFQRHRLRSTNVFVKTTAASSMA